MFLSISFFVVISWNPHALRIARVRLKALLTIAACRDVVERVRSMCILLSMISAAGHPLHLPFFFVFLKRKFSSLKNRCLYISFLDHLIIFQWFLFFPDFFASLVLQNTFSRQINHFFFFHLFLLRWKSYNNHIYTDHTVTYWVMWPSRDSIGRMLGWHAQIEKRNQVCVFAHVDEVVLSGCWRVTASWLFFSLFVPHAWCSGSVRVDCCAWCAILVCLLVHDTRICNKAQTQSAAECDAHCELLDQWTNLTSQKVIASQSSSAHVIIYIIYYKKD